MCDKLKSSKKKSGRRSSFRAETTQAILEQISKGIPLSVICKQEGMPHPSTVREWMKTNPEFADEMAIARETGFDAIAMEILAIADDASKDTIDSKFGSMPNKEWILRAKLKCEMRLKLLAKWDPKRYGEKISAELSGPNGGPIESSAVYLLSEADEEAIKRIAETRERLRVEASRDRG